MYYNRMRNKFGKMEMWVVSSKGVRKSVACDVNWEEGNLYARSRSLVLTELKNKEEDTFFIQP